MAYTTDTRATGASFFSRFAALRSTMVERMAANRVYRTTSKELSNLSDRDLADLGISRSAIRGIALEAAYGK